jgi:hypothetical protein
VPSVEEGLKTQVRNIEARYGRSMADWTEVVRQSGRSRHGEILALLKTEHRMSHGDANRVALVTRDAIAGSPPAAGDPTEALYAGRAAALRQIHDRLLATINGFGGDIEVAPKRGYLSLRRARQFAMIQPSTRWVEVGLILKASPVGGRLEKNPNAMFTHRVRLSDAGQVDAELTGWLREAYDRA